MSQPPPKPQSATISRPRIAVVGVGGAGGNAINNMISSGLTGVEYVVANTDAQALAMSSAECRIQLGVNLTEGLGAGSKPEIGEAAAEEALDDIRSRLTGSHMVFIAAGMGGGTGTGAAGVVARASRELGILTVGIVTKPFQFEGTRRMRTAEAGIVELKKYVDTLIVIPNQNLFRVATERTSFADAFALADQVLYAGVACIVDLIVKDGLINLDFADVRTVMCGMGSAMMGTGEASGERRATAAAEEAISNPLLDDVSLKGAKGLLLSIIGGRDMTLYEVDEAASRVRQEVDPEANIIVGATFDESMEDRVRVAIVASGMARVPHDAREFGNGAAPATSRVPPGWASSQRDSRARGEHAPADWRGADRNQLENLPVNELQQRISAAIGREVEHRYAGQPEEPRSVPRSHPRSRGAWQGPGGVLIEENVPQHGEPDEPRTAPPPIDGQADFAPAPPHVLRRASRRPPEASAYASSSGERARAEPPYRETPPSRDYDSSGSGAPRKKSLLQRLVSAGRGSEVE